AITAPVDRGLMGLYNRIVCWLGNSWYALRTKKFRDFRVFVHDLAAIEARVVGAGFRPRIRQHRRLVWDLRVYERDAPQVAAGRSLLSAAWRVAMTRVNRPAFLPTTTSLSRPCPCRGPPPFLDYVRTA